MAVKPPPSRYRVIERGRRLEVIDTQPHLRAEYYVPQPAPPVVAVEPEPEPGAPWSEPPAPSVAARFDAALAELTEPAPPRPGPAQPPEFLRIVATTVCSDERDSDGRLVLTTARFYDSRGPRRIRLDREGERAVGGAMVGILAGIVFAIIFALSWGWFGLILLVIAASAVRQVKTIATPALDRLALRSP